MLKYLRIAVTALSLTACVLLVALWVRSYWRADAFEGALGRWFLESESQQGQLWAAAWHSGSTAEWSVDSYTVDGFDKIPLRLDFGFWADGAAIWAPYWLLVMMSASAPAARRIASRFTLRTLLIVTTLVAVVLGIVAA